MKTAKDAKEEKLTPRPKASGTSSRQCAALPCEEVAYHKLLISST